MSDDYNINPSNQNNNFGKYQGKQNQCKYRWWITPLWIIGSFIAIVIIGIMAIVGIVATVGNEFKEKEVVVKNNSVLELNLANIKDANVFNPSAIFGKSEPAFYNLLQIIKEAADDDKIMGIYYNASPMPIGAAKAKEIQDALYKFKESGKFIYAFIEAGDETQYFNALPADSIFMPTEGIMELNGYAAFSIFWKGLYEKIGLKYNVIQFEEYKSFGETYNRTSYSDAAKAEIRVRVDKKYKNIIASIAKARNMTEEQVKSYLDKGLFTANEALEAGFIDGVLPETEVRNLLQNKADAEKLKLVSASSYFKSNSFGNYDYDKRNQTIAIINAEGAIQSGGMQNFPFSQDGGIYADNIIKIIRKVRDNDNIKGVILRINSPGGSVIASEEIGAEIEELAKKKPVFASMSDVAASGGYWLSLACDSMFAEPETITGSIGVIAVIPNVSGMMKKFGVTFDTVTTGKNAFTADIIFNENSPMLQKFKTSSGDVYRRFVEKTAKKRGMTYEEARAVAKGRVWSGDDAYENGLLDGLANLEEVIQKMKLEIGVEVDDEVPIKLYPNRKDEFEQIFEMLGLEITTEIFQNDEVKSYMNKIGANLSLYQEVKNSLPKELSEQFDYMMNIFKMSDKEKVLMIAPTKPE